MTIDQYQLCPCGSNKKVKFCCAQDVLPEINKVLTALQGNQRVAALDHVNHAIEKKGDKDCLLNIKTNILLQLGEEEKARETAKQVLKKNPDNPIALANHGLLDASSGALDDAVDKLQQCMDLIGETIPFSVVEAVKLVGVSLLQSSRITAGRSHLMLYQALHPEADEKITRLIQQTFMNPKIPVLLKAENLPAPAPEEAPWKSAAEEANALGSRGRWLTAIEKLQELDEKHPDQPVIRKNLAIYQNCLGTPEDMAEAWSDYAHTPGVDFVDAVEAEAFAQLIDPDLEAELLDVVSVEFALSDVEKLTEKLADEKRCDAVPIAEDRFDPDQPKPRASYLIFDRERPETSEGLTRETIPNVCCQVYVFGKQTDREARIQLVTTKNDQYEERVAKTREVLGDLMGDEGETQVVSQVTKLSDTLTWDWQFPVDTPRELQTRMLNEQRREIMLEKWPKLAQPSLGGKSPEEVIGQDKYRIALAAAVLLLEVTTDHQISLQVDLDDLRDQLEVPRRKLFEASEFSDILEISPVRLGQIDYSGMPDDDLIQVFQRAGITASYRALTLICNEILSRDSLEEKIDKTSVYMMLARMEPELDQAVQLIQKARNLCISKKVSPAMTLIAELEARLERGDVEKAPDLIRDIEAKYIREPGVGNELMRVLVRFGIVDPRGNPQPDKPKEPTAEATVPDSKYVWTPGGDSSPEPEKPAEEKKLWIPGMD
ncbi:MAG: hypothetical protein VX768_08665 [Planctomycetota bacterium]|nr:hypothetical protein [Planctomycetota bacterium]